ncbi:MAG: DUF308 domain-containing protein [Bradyrhizobium sp.]|nr:DUF308 domain-containing protein [Bradyrhizobium sp.]
MIWPQLSTLAVDLYVGWMFLISGLIGLFTIFVASSATGFVWSLLTAALSLFLGVLLLWHPVEGAVSLTLVLISFFIPRARSRSRLEPVSRSVPGFLGLAVDERHRRPGACRDADLGMAIDRDLGARPDCRP